jgi:hypothetical protein
MLHNRRYLSPGYKPGFQKTYLSRELTRAMSIDMPIGDPHGGAAYGERNDPISAIVSIATIAGTGGAVLAGTATLMTGLAFAGAALSLVGNITGNNFLSKAGMITGLVGGIGGLAESAGLFSSGTLGETFGYGDVAQQMGGGLKVSQAAGNVSPVVEGAQQATAGTVDDILANPITARADATSFGRSLEVSGAGGTGLQVTPSAAANALTPTSLAGATAPLASSAAPIAAPGTPTVSLANSPTSLVSAPSVSGTGVSVPNVESVMPTPNFGGLSQTAAPGNPVSNVMSGVKDLGVGAMKFLKDNPNAAYVIGSAAGSVGDYLSGKTEAQIDQMEASGELSKAQAERARYEIQLNKDRIARLNQNYANVPNPLANYNPNFQVAPMPGIIANSMQPVG